MTDKTTDKTVAKYVSRHAEPEARLELKLPGSFGHVVVIPAYGESESLFAALASVPKGPQGEALVILVVNDRDESPDWVHRSNRAFVADFTKRLGRPENLTPLKESDSGPPIGFLRLAASAVLLVDRTTASGFPLPPGAGVGQARKIGADIASALIHRGLVRSPWIHNTDADVVLPPDYFEQLRGAPKDAAACVYPFAHKPDADPVQARAMLAYEITLRHYVTGLASAGSPYAFHTIGSTMAVHAHAYAAVRGFPQRNAAEDFYLLNKIAKTGGVVRLRGYPIEIAGRLSDRVPFGTGKSLIRIVDEANHGEGYRTYDPIVFAYLSAWLRALEKSVMAQVDPLAEVKGQAEAINLDPDLLWRVIGEMNGLREIAAIRERTKQPRQALRAAHEWFDGFRTLKFIHALRAEAYPSLPVVEALGNSPWGPAEVSESGENRSSGYAHIEKLLHHLRRAEDHHTPRVTGTSAVTTFPSPP